ncbi:MAG: hypothetical protein DI591_05860 [Citromicrobium sp.]|nr:MAG: hypothetical protein DI591_05860 [Citromicrobium sp.]
MPPCQGACPTGKPFVPAMLIYLILFGVAALLALTLPKHGGTLGLGSMMALIGFGVLYAAVAALRYEIGGDWHAYMDMYDRARLGTIGESLAITDPAFGLLMYLGSAVGGGMYLVNGFCAAILFYGVARTAAQTREPWLAITVALPYLLIVVGMGYIRQAAAIGMVLIAIDTVRRERPALALLQLFFGLMFHSTSIVVWPFFAMALANRNKLRILLISTIGAAIVLALIISRADEFSAGYLDAEYSSGGALIRLLMGVIPSLVLVLSVRRFQVGGRARSIWIGLALANLVAIIALILLSSSTAVDRIALYFTGVQLIAFGSIGELLGFSPRIRIFLRLLVSVYALATLLVFLIYASHAYAWNPYRSILAFL